MLGSGKLQLFFSRKYVLDFEVSFGRQPLFEEENNCLWDIIINVLSTYAEKFTHSMRSVDLENMC